MSHNITMSNVRITDTDMFAQVVTELSEGKARLDLTQKTFRTERMLGGTDKCDACVVMPGQLDIGLLNQNGAFVPKFGAMGMDPIFRGGYNAIGKLVQEYTLREAEYQAAQNGMTTERIPTKDGGITLECVAAS